MSGFLKKTIQISFILVAIFAISNMVFAQGSVSNSVSSIYLSIFPSNPRAGDSITLTLSSDILDLDSSKIVWYVDGVARKETTSKNITIKTKNDGQKTTIRVVVETFDGIIKEISRDISLSGIDFIVEPVSYTLPFYKGKPFFIPLGAVRVTALPDIMINGTKVSSKDLGFRWTNGDDILGLSSGKGKNSIVINSTVPVRNLDIGVQVSDDSGSILAESSKIVSLGTPKILFYENSPLYGVLYNKAIVGSYFLGTKEELKIVAKPFSFSFLKDTSEGSSYAWSVNGNYVVPNGKTNEIILRQTTTSLKGTANISLDLKNTNKINQYTSEGFSVEFGQ